MTHTRSMVVLALAVVLGTLLWALMGLAVRWLI
jgi:hypothetical protein